jgi:hypothetical protein
LGGGHGPSIGFTLAKRNADPFQRSAFSITAAGLDQIRNGSFDLSRDFDALFSNSPTNNVFIVKGN